MSASPEEIVKTLKNLVSLPEVCARVQTMIDDPDSSIEKIGKVISQDPALATRLLGIANSSLYGFAHKIDTISRALTIVGTGQVRSLLIATSAVKVFENIPNDLVTMDDFWRHSIYCGLVARLLTRHFPPMQEETMFVAGLLHDIGQLVLFNKAPSQEREALLLSLEDDEEPDIYEAERKVLGFDHAQVGAELIRQWQLPDSLREIVEFHHQPAKAVHFPKEVAVIHIANSLACLAELNSLDQGDAPPIDPAAWEITGLTPQIIEPAVEEAREQFGDAQSSFMS